MRWEQAIQYASLSDVGFRRRNNEDNCCVHVASDRELWLRRGHLFLVADGMGGHAVGELASKMAVDTIPHTFFKSREPDVSKALVEAVRTANKAIHTRGSQNIDFHRMGTTCAALVLCSAGAITGHVGDSRVYRVRSSRIDLFTADHSLQWELEQRGGASEYAILNEARHIITRSLGPQEDVEVELTGPHSVRAGDVFVVCSDGLTAHVSDEEIGLIARDLPVAEACRLLVHLANLRGGSDNITVIVVRVGAAPGEPEPEPLPPPPPGEERVSTNLLVAAWALAAQFAAGLILILAADQPVWGTLLVLVALVGAVLLALRPPGRHDEPDDTFDHSARVAPARTTPLKHTNHRLLQELATLEADLRRSATEEEWSIDWQAHQQALAAAKSALSEKNYPRALQELGRCIDTLMFGVHQFRKQLVREIRWGKGAANSS